MSELERLRALVSGASTASDRETALAYLGAARSLAFRIEDEVREILATVKAIEDAVAGVKRGAQKTLVGK